MLYLTLVCHGYCKNSENEPPQIQAPPPPPKKKKRKKKKKEKEKKNRKNIHIKATYNKPIPITPGTYR